LDELLGDRDELRGLGSDDHRKLDSVVRNALEAFQSVVVRA
jgi:hypothetical protein